MKNVKLKYVKPTMDIVEFKEMDSIMDNNSKLSVVSSGGGGSVSWSVVLGKNK